MFEKKKLVERLEVTKNNLQYQGQRSAGTFPTGLPDGEIIIGNPRERLKRVDKRWIYATNN